MPENAENGATAADCLFCKIVAGEIPSNLVYEGERVIAFRDINPQAPMHVLVVPRAHAPNLAATAAADPGLVGELATVAAEVAGEEGYSDYNVVANTGSEAGQTIFHTHLHVLGGRKLTSLTNLPG
ncbi:histidine triad nucleotide-binding protein [Nocardioides insulae]|uniref:histidine triad nucleotide-binding protein n=1 Tax=Nocardioides insulae TaxID=394734 RepID=UPI0004060B38|nr:histidine triad nucleotide-binding protein [Nocardioides insulae]